MNNIAERNKIYISLAGCGKTSVLIQEAKKALSKNEKILYLSFNKKIRFEVIKYHKLSKEQVHTFHSFAYNELIKNNNIFELFKDCDVTELEECLQEDKITINKNSLTQKALNELIPTWCDQAQQSSYTNLDYIIVDEIQDLDDNMTTMIKLLRKINNNDVKIIAAGDPYQTIYSFKNFGKINNIFNNFQKYFGPTDIVELNINYRSSASILKFANGYYEKQFNDNRLFDLSTSTQEKFTDDVYIHCIQHKRDLNNKILEIINLYPDKKVTIMGRVKEELKTLEFDYKNISISTIHAEKGKECDVAIIINTIFNDKVNDIEDKNVWNVAITRAKEKLHIVSSFPKEIILSKFKEETYTLLDEQKQFAESEIKDIPNEKIHLTINKVNKSMIDSIDLQLHYDDACFIPFEKQNLKRDSSFKTDTRLTINNFDFVLHRNNKQLTFDYHDLSKLKNQYYNDKEIIQNLETVQQKYFSLNCHPQDIDQQKIKRLDLALYFKVPSKKILNTLIMFFKLSRNTDSYSNKRTCLYEGSTGTHTAYLNSKLTKQEKGKLKKLRGITAYFPEDKENENKLYDGENILKVELSRTKIYDKKLLKGYLNMSFSELKGITFNNKLNELYYEWLYYEFPYLKENPVKNAELIKERYNIKTLDDVIQTIDSGNLKIRDKKNLFYVLLSLIEKDEAEIIKDIFKIPFC